MPSLAFRKASICSRYSFSASCTLVVNPQHATRSRLILYWKLSSPLGSSCIGKDSPLRRPLPCVIIISLYCSRRRVLPLHPPRTQEAHPVKHLIFLALMIMIGSVMASAGEQLATAVPDLAQLQKMTARSAPTALDVDISNLSEGDRKALVKLVEAARVIDDVYMTQYWSGDLALYAKLQKDTCLLYT